MDFSTFTVDVIVFLLVDRRQPPFALFPYTTLFRSVRRDAGHASPLDDTDSAARQDGSEPSWRAAESVSSRGGSEEHKSELQSRLQLVCRLLLEKKKRVSVPQAPMWVGAEAVMGALT